MIVINLIDIKNMLDIQEKIIELKKLEQEYLQKKKEISQEIENDFAQNLNKTTEDKLKVFKLNVHNYYDQQNKSNSYFKENFPNTTFYSMLLNSMLENGCSDPTPKEAIEYENLIEAFSQLFKEDKFKVTNSKIYQYNTETNEIIYSGSDWQKHRIQVDHNIFNNDPNKYTGSSTIVPRQCSDWKIIIHIGTVDEIVEAVKYLYHKKKEVHIYKAFIQLHHDTDYHRTVLELIITSSTF